MNILVVGGAGYIGSLLVPALLERGHRVVVSDTLWFGNHLPEDVEVFVGDAFELEASALDGFDAMVFLAGLSNDPMADFSPRLNFEGNAALPAYLGYIARRAGLRRVIFASSCSVYGYAPEELSLESGPTRTTTPYGLSKLAAERALLNMAAEDFSVIALRKGTVSGYSPRMRLDLLLNTMFKSAIGEGQVVVSNPSVWRPVLGIGDAVRAYVRALEAPEDCSGVFNILSGNFTLGHLGDVVHQFVQQELGQPCRLRIDDVEEIRSYKVDGERARVALGFEALESPLEILRSLAANLSSFDDFELSDFYNIRVFKDLDLGTR